MSTENKVLNIIGFIIGGFSKSICVISGSFYLFIIAIRLFQLFKHHILHLPLKANAFGVWIGCCIVGMISVVIYLIDSIITLCRIKKSKNLVIDIINISLSVILAALLLPIGGAANIYNTFWLIFVVVLTILEGYTFYRYFFKKRSKLEK